MGQMKEGKLDSKKGDMEWIIINHLIYSIFESDF